MLYGSAFLAPSPYTTYQHYGSFIPNTNANGNVTGFQSFFWHLPNPDLQPERLNTFELGLDYKITKNIRISTNGFYNQLTDLITTEINSDGTLFKNVLVFDVEKPVNNGEASTYGGTIKVNAVESIGGDSSATKINIALAYSYINGEIMGGELPEVSNQFIKSTIDFIHTKLILDHLIILNFI